MEYSISQICQKHTVIICNSMAWLMILVSGTSQLHHTISNLLNLPRHIWHTRFRVKAVQVGLSSFHVQPLKLDSLKTKQISSQVTKTLPTNQFVTSNWTVCDAPWRIYIEKYFSPYHKMWHVSRIIFVEYLPSLWKLCSNKIIPWIQ